MAIIASFHNPPWFHAQCVPADGQIRRRRKYIKRVDLAGKKILVTGVTGQVAAPVVVALSKTSKVYALARFKDAKVRAALEDSGVATIARLSVPYGDNGGWPFFHVLMMQKNMAIDVHPDRPNTYNPLHSDDYIGKIPNLLGIASVDVTTLNFGGSQPVSIEEWCAYLGELTDFVPQFRDNPEAFGALSIDTDEMQRLIGPTQVDWREGMRRMVQSLAPQLIKN